MHLRHGTSLLNNPLPFWTCVNTFTQEKMMMKNVASLNNLALFIYLTGRQLHCVAIQEFLLYLQYHSH